VKVGRPLALKAFAGEGKAFIGRLHVAQSRAGQNQTEEASHHRRDERNVADESGERDPEGVDPRHGHA